MRDELEQALMAEGDLLAGRQIIDLSPVGVAVSAPVGA